MEERDLECRRCVELNLRPVGQLVQRPAERIGLYDAAELCRGCFKEMRAAQAELVG